MRSFTISLLNILISVSLVVCHMFAYVHALITNLNHSPVLVSSLVFIPLPKVISVLISLLTKSTSFTMSNLSMTLFILLSFQISITIIHFFYVNHPTLSASSDYVMLTAAPYNASTIQATSNLE